MAAQFSSQPVPIGTVISSIPLTLNNQFYDRAVTVSYAKDDQDYLVFPAISVNQLTLEIDGVPTILTDANGRFNVKPTDQNAILTISVVNYSMETAYRNAVLDAFAIATGAKIENIRTVAKVGTLRGRLATPSNENITNEELVFFANQSILNKRFYLGVSELTALQYAKVDEMQFFIDITYRAQFTEDVFKIKLSLIAGTITQLTNRLASTSNAASTTPPKYLIGLGGNVQANGNGLQDIKTAFQLQVMRNADISVDQSAWATQMVNDLLSNIPGIETNFDMNQHKTSSDVVTVLLGDRVKITAPFNELNEIQNHLEAQTEDQLKTDFENSLKNSSAISSSAKGAYGPISGEASGSTSHSREESAKALVESTKKNLSKLDELIKGRIANIAALKVDDLQNFVNTNTFSKNAVFSNFQESTAVTTSDPFSLTNTYVDQISTFGTPIGSVLAYVGSGIPTGWLLCDGRPLKDTADYHTLYSHPVFGIGKSHGAGYDSNGIQVGDFNLPDYRGYFLRGVDIAGHADPDIYSRTPMKPGGNDKGAVGSVQQPATCLPTTNVFGIDGGSHSHTVEIKSDISDQNGWPSTVIALRSGLNPQQGYQISTQSDGAHSHTLRGGDLETRPKNAYVYWIIKYQ